jgi:hypothetical protein
MPLEEPPSQRAPRPPTGSGKRRRQDQRPAFARPRDARDRHRIAEREGAAIAGRRDIDPCDCPVSDISARSARSRPARGRKLTIGTTCPSVRSDRDRPIRLRHPPRPDQVGQDRDREVGARGMADDQHLVHLASCQRIRDPVGEFASRASCAPGRRRDAAPKRRSHASGTRPSAGRAAETMSAWPRRCPRRGRWPGRPPQTVPAPARAARRQPPVTANAERHRQHQLPQKHHHRERAPRSPAPSAAASTGRAPRSTGRSTPSDRSAA